MVKTILLDCGGVMCRPITGTWLFPVNFHALMDQYLTDVPVQEHKQARNTASKHMDAYHLVYTEDHMCEQLYQYFHECYREILHLPVPESVIVELALSETYDNSRFLFYDDVLPVMEKWSGQYQMALVSDTLPDLRRALRQKGMLQLMDAASLSCECNAFKPSAILYERALEALHTDPEATIFIDDLEKNLYGAQACGIRGVKMVREYYTDEPILLEGTWQGLSVGSLQELADKLEAGLI